MRKRAWQGREVPLEPETWALFPARRLGPGAEAEKTELLRAVQRRDRRRADPAPAERPGRLDPEWRPDRRPRRAPGHDPRRALQDPARRPPQAPQAAGDCGLSLPRSGRPPVSDRADRDRPRPAARAGRARDRLRHVLRGARRLRRARARRRRRRGARSPACAHTSPAAPRAGGVRGPARAGRRRTGSLDPPDPCGSARAKVGGIGVFAYLGLWLAIPIEQESRRKHGGGHGRRLGRFLRAQVVELGGLGSV